MGLDNYTTEFEGSWTLDRPLDATTAATLSCLSIARRDLGGDRDPDAQPNARCRWAYDSKDKAIRWDGGEDFYDYIKWIEYIIDRVLVPMGEAVDGKPYVLNGKVRWTGKCEGDTGCIAIVDNKVGVEDAARERDDDYEDEEEEDDDRAARAYARALLMRLISTHRKPVVIPFRKRPLRDGGGARKRAKCC